jgi:hypothetical protein
MILLAKLDRLAIGSILRSKLVFLISVRSRVVFSFTAGEGNAWPTFCRVCGH